MHKFLRQLITEWRKLGLPFKDATVVVAVSGGADSSALLLALGQLRDKKKLNLKFVIAHFNHGLRGKDSDKDEKFVRKLAEKIGFDLECGRGKLKRASDLEQAARNERYEFLNDVADRTAATAVLTAHTMDDQAETFLMRLVRGSGIDGLGAMKSVRLLSEGSAPLLVRPMLSWARRDDTEGFCRENKLKFRNDAMNRDEAFLRVKMRKKVIPILRDINPGIVQTLARTADVLRDERDELESAAHLALRSQDRANAGNISVKWLQKLSPAQRRRIIRLWLSGQRGGLRRLGMEHFAAIERLVLKGAGGKVAGLPEGEAVTVLKGALVFRKIGL